MSELVQKGAPPVAYHEYAREGEHRASSWVGWVGFGGVIMILSGIMQAIAGLVGIFRDTFFVIGNNSSQLLLVHNVHEWGWINLVIGIIVFLAGFSLLSGAAWARVVAVIFAAGSIIANMVNMPLYPLWSILAIALGIVVIYAIVAHGGELGEVQ